MFWGSYPVEHDVHGVWLYTPARSLYRGTTPTREVVVCHAGWPDPPGAPVIHLIPTRGWWFARWQDVPTGAHVAIDICTPSELHGGVWSYDDIELDLLKCRDGAWRLDDQDGISMRAGRRPEVFAMSDDHIGIDTFDDPVLQLMSSHHWWVVDNRVVHRAQTFRYISPAELELMGRLVGLRLVDRWGWWDKTPFTAQSVDHIAVFEKVVLVAPPLQARCERIVLVATPHPR